MGLVWRNGDMKDLRANFENAVTNMEDEATSALVDAVELGYDTMLRVIDTSGTGYVGRGPRATPEGRIDYGTMRDSVDRDINKSGSTISGEFGWLENQEEYFRYQENGTARIPPMHALLTAFITARERVRRDLVKIAKKGVR